MAEPTKKRWLGHVAVASAVAVLVGGDMRVTGTPPDKAIALTPIGVYRSGVFDGSGSEIPTYDPASQRLFVVNFSQQRIDVIGISNPAQPSLAFSIDIRAWGRHPNSVAVRDGVLAVAVEADDKTDPGKAVFFDTDGGFLSAVTVGALPDMVTFTHNGRFALVANEGEPNSYGLADSVDPEGSVSIIDMRRGAANVLQDDVATADFRDFNDATLDASVRIFGPGSSIAQDLEPEYIAVSHDSRTAWVSLQENNALGILDLTSKQFTRIVGLGFKDHSLPGQGLDASDRDGQQINIAQWPVHGMFMPDGLATFEHNGRTYVLSANEGDVREWPGLPDGIESRRIGSGSSGLTLDPTRFPNAATLKTNARLARLNVTIYNGDTDGDTDFDDLYTFGARSFSVWDDAGRQVYDSGDDFEQITKLRAPALFNANHTNNQNTATNPNDWTRDSRSDDKGPEPEDVKVARLFGRQYAFIGLERIGGVMVYELTNPVAPRFVDYINVRTLNAAADSAAAEDLGAEGMIVISEDDSPNGRPLLVVANEVSGTTRIYEISSIR